MAVSDADRARMYRRNKGIGPRSLIPCGELAAYNRHLAEGETPCDACREANSRAAREKRARRRARELAEAAEAEAAAGSEVDGELGGGG